jgi:protein-L-isoaspartate(D-aspartate) O-methyltransferase
VAEQERLEEAGMDEGVAAARRSFAEELRYTARVSSAAVVAAFATVPRERFAGPGPWQLLSPMRMSSYWSTGDADPRHLYHDVLIAIDPVRRLTTGGPAYGLPSTTSSSCLRVAM